MSQETPHTYQNRHGKFSVRFDELEPEDTITMRKATFEKLANVKIDAGIPDRTKVLIGVPKPAEVKPVEPFYGADALEKLDHDGAQGNVLVADPEPHEE